MTEYIVRLVTAVYTNVTVEANNLEDAIDKAYDSDSITNFTHFGTVGSVQITQSGDWEAISVIDSSGKMVWEH